MASVVTGFSIDEKLLKQVDRLAKRRKLSRSALVSSVLEREVDRDMNGESVTVVVDGVRFVQEGKDYVQVKKP